MTFSREFFDTLIFIVIVIGAALAFVRLYQDFTRPLPPSQHRPDSDTHDSRDD